MMRTCFILLIAFLALKGVVGKVDDVTDGNEPVVGDCILNKWKAWSTPFDVDKDGILSLSDMNQTSRVFNEIHNLSGDDKVLREEMLAKLWSDLFLGNKTELSVTEFVYLQINALKEDKQKLVGKLQKSEDLLVRFADVNNDSFLSETEETLYLMALGHTDKTKNKMCFKDFDPEDKGVPAEVILKYFVKYLTEEDCNEPDNLNRKDPMSEFSESH